jgi:hypothetical protein
MKSTVLSFTSALLLAVATASLPASSDDKADAVVGTWTWSWKDAEGVTHKHTLEVEGTGDKLAARETYDELEPIKVTDLKRTGKTVTFSVLRGKRQSSYSGELKESDRIEGKVNVTIEGQTSEYGWEAKREAKKSPKGTRPNTDV